MGKPVPQGERPVDGVFTLHRHGPRSHRGQCDAARLQNGSPGRDGAAVTGTWLVRALVARALSLHCVALLDERWSDLLPLSFAAASGGWDFWPGARVGCTAQRPTQPHSFLIFVCSFLLDFCLNCFHQFFIDFLFFQSFGFPFLGVTKAKN